MLFQIISCYNKKERKKQKYQHTRKQNIRGLNKEHKPRNYGKRVQSKLSVQFGEGIKSDWNKIQKSLGKTPKIERMV